MSSGPKNVTSTTNSEPPAFLLGPLTTAANAAVSDFGGATSGGGSGAPLGGGRFDRGTPLGQGRFNRGSTAGGASPEPQGPDLIGQSQGLVSNTLNGDFLNSNPYLDQTFNRAADLTRGRLDTEFAGAGRNLGASHPARSEELQTLASNIYGQNYQAERDRQTSAIDQSQGLDPINLLINRLAGIIPGAGGSTQSTQPVFRTGLF